MSQTLPYRCNNCWTYFHKECLCPTCNTMGYVVRVDRFQNMGNTERSKYFKGLQRRTKKQLNEVIS